MILMLKLCRLIIILAIHKPMGHMLPMNTVHNLKCNMVSAAASTGKLIVHALLCTKGAILTVNARVRLHSCEYHSNARRAADMT